MIPIRKNLESHRGQGVVWSSLGGPVRGWIDDVQVTYRRNGDKDIVFIVDTYKGERRRRMTQHMLYPNMTEWRKHKVELLEIMKKHLTEKKGLSYLYDKMLDACSFIGSNCPSPQEVRKFLDLLNEINERAYTLMEVTDPVESASSDAEIIREINEKIRLYTPRNRKKG